MKEPGLFGEHFGGLGTADSAFEVPFQMPTISHGSTPTVADVQRVLATAVADCGLRDAHEAGRANVAFWQWFSTVATCRDHESLVMLKGSVDQVWHAYILHTRLYRSLCERYIGSFLEHQPQAERPSDRQICETVERLYSRYVDDLSPLLATWSPTTISRLRSKAALSRPLSPAAAGAGDLGLQRVP